jgi:tRNA-2-methylthio-N6-dimethylallyladenosine synthase
MPGSTYCHHGIRPLEWPLMSVLPEKPLRSVHIKTFGCQMNVYDSDRMSSVLADQGFRWEPELRRADVILLNTCAIRDKAEHKVLSLLGELKPLKQEDPSKVIGVTGCVGQRIGRQLLQRVAHLDLVTGPDGVDRIGTLVRSVIDEGKRVLDTQLDGEGRQYSQPNASATSRPVEYLTIMKGCDHFCTYCIVPFVRGREKSRSIAEIISDVKRLVAGGTREITFLGQNINTYGKGTLEKLSMLIEEADKVEGLLRIRYVTSHPRDLGDDLIEQFGRVEKLCPALHLPVQSGSDAVLKRMSRLYTSAQYLEKIEKLRKACPDISLSGDVIVGFPGESEEDFVQTLKIVEEVRYTNIFMFKYSPRPGTRAYEYAEVVPEKVKEERLIRLQEVAYRIMNEESGKKVGRVEPCLVEGIDRKGRNFFGRTPDNRLVHVMNAGHACVGKVVDVEITEINTSNLKGFYVDAPRESRYRTNPVTEAISAPV